MLEKLNKIIPTFMGTLCTINYNNNNNHNINTTTTNTNINTNTNTNININTDMYIEVRPLKYWLQII